MQRARRGKIPSRPRCCPAVKGCLGWCRLRYWGKVARQGRAYTGGARMCSLTRIFLTRMCSRSRMCSVTKLNSGHRGHTHTHTHTTHTHTTHSVHSVHASPAYESIKIYLILRPRGVQVFTDDSGPTSVTGKSKY